MAGNPTKNVKVRYRYLARPLPNYKDKQFGKQFDIDHELYYDKDEIDNIYKRSFGKKETMRQYNEPTPNYEEIYSIREVIKVWLKMVGKLLLVLT